MAMKHNFHAALLILAGSVMTMHYSSIISHFPGCPTIVAEGHAETGKSTAMSVALSITGKTFQFSETLPDLIKLLSYVTCIIMLASIIKVPRVQFMKGAQIPSLWSDHLCPPYRTALMIHPITLPKVAVSAI